MLIRIIFDKLIKKSVNFKSCKLTDFFKDYRFVSLEIRLLNILFFV